MKALFDFSIVIAVIVVMVMVLPVALRDRRKASAAKTAGKASFYGEAYRGKTMADGHRFDPDGMTCASFSHPLGTMLRVRALLTGRAVIVEVTDRGPALWTARMIDLSERAFARIAPLKWGVTEVEVEVIAPAQKHSHAPL